MEEIFIDCPSRENRVAGSVGKRFEPMEATMPWRESELLLQTGDGGIMTKLEKTTQSKTADKGKRPKSKGNKKETRDKILKAARQIFSSYPYHTASIRMIGKLAGIEHPLISYYFPSKADLFRSVMEELIENRYQEERRWLEIAKTMKTARGFSVFLDNVLDHYRRHPEVFHIVSLNMVQSVDSEPIPGYDLIKNFMQASIRNFTEIVDLSVPDHEVEMFARAMSMQLIGFLGGANYFASLMNMDPDSIPYYNWVKDTLLYTLLPRLEQMVGRRPSENRE
ncbi:MAG: TetR/AcrR family transcriptional regulator [Proteobacteria bacterium]|nr:TetR/AcrR family transcriptional regulator [Pseudomonadota bacterium]